MSSNELQNLVKKNENWIFLDYLENVFFSPTIKNEKNFQILKILYIYI